MGFQGFSHQTSAATAALRAHLRSAGMTYQGAQSVEHCSSISPSGPLVAGSHSLRSARSPGLTSNGFSARSRRASQALALLLLESVEHELQDGRAVSRTCGPLERVDLFIALLDCLL